MTELLTVSEFARRVGKTPGAIYADIARGRWPTVKVGRRVYFKPDTLERFIAAHERPALETPDPSGRRGKAA